MQALVFLTFYQYTTEIENIRTGFSFFLKKWFEVWNDTSGYLEFCKQGSTGKAKVEGRIETMEKELKEYAIQLVMEKGA